MCMILVSGGGCQCRCDVGLVKMWKERLTGRGYLKLDMTSIGCGTRAD